MEDIGRVSVKGSDYVWHGGLVGLSLGVLVGDAIGRSGSDNSRFKVVPQVVRSVALQGCSQKRLSALLHQRRLRNSKWVT